MPTELKFKRKNKIEIDSLPIEDGSVIFSKDSPEIFMDDGSERKVYGGDIYEGIKYVNHEVYDTTFELPPNEFHVWSEVKNLTLTLQSPTNLNIVNEYIFRFISGSTPTTLSLPESIETDIVIEPNTYYECSIINNYMVFREWGVVLG